MEFILLFVLYILFFMTLGAMGWLLVWLWLAGFGLLVFIAGFVMVLSAGLALIGDDL